MKTLLIIVLVYIVLAMVGRYIFPLIIKWYVKRFSKRFYDGMNQKYQQNNDRKEGEIHIDHIPEKDKNSNSDKGDYVDYEEIK